MFLFCEVEEFIEYVNFIERIILYSLFEYNDIKINDLCLLSFFLMVCIVFRVMFLSYNIIFLFV